METVTWCVSFKTEVDLPAELAEESKARKIEEVKRLAAIGDNRIGVYVGTAEPVFAIGKLTGEIKCEPIDHFGGIPM